MLRQGFDGSTEDGGVQGKVLRGYPRLNRSNIGRLYWAGGRHCGRGCNVDCARSVFINIPPPTAHRVAVGHSFIFAFVQVFIPSVEVEYTSTHHADILCRLGPMMDETEWKAKGLDNYGLIAVNADGNAAQVQYSTTVQYLEYPIFYEGKLLGTAATTKAVPHYLSSQEPLVQYHFPLGCVSRFELKRNNSDGKVPL